MILGVKNICSLVDKEIRGKLGTNYPTEQQIKIYKRHGPEFIKDEKFMYAHECIIMPMIMHCTVSTPKSIEFKSNLGLSQYVIALNKEQSVIKSIMETFEGENMQTQYSVLDYRSDLYFHEYKLAIEIDEKGHTDRNIDQEIKRQKALEKRLDCKFIRINPDEENFNISKTKIETFRHIKESNKKITGESTKKSY